MVRAGRLELPRLSTLEPKSSASTNSATLAQEAAHYIRTWQRDKHLCCSIQEKYLNIKHFGQKQLNSEENALAVEARTRTSRSFYLQLITIQVVSKSHFTMIRLLYTSKGLRLASQGAAHSM